MAASALGGRGHHEALAVLEGDGWSASGSEYDRVIRHDGREAKMAVYRIVLAALAAAIVVVVASEANSAGER